MECADVFAVRRNNYAIGSVPSRLGTPDDSGDRHRACTGILRCIWQGVSAGIASREY